MPSRHHEPPPKISKAYLFGWSDQPFKERTPPPPPPPPEPRPSKLSMMAAPGGVFEYIASDGRKGKLTGSVAKLSIMRGPYTTSLTKANLSKVSANSGERRKSRSKSSVAQANGPPGTPVPEALNAGVWAGLANFEAPKSSSSQVVPAAGNAEAAAAPASASADAANADTAKQAAVKEDNPAGFTDEQDKELIRRKTENETWAEIATALGKEKHEVQTRWKQVMPTGWQPNQQGKGKKGKNKGGDGKTAEEKKREGMGKQERKKAEAEEKRKKKEEEEKQDDSGGFGMFNGDGSDAGDVTNLFGDGGNEDENKNDNSKGAGGNPSGAWDNDPWGNGDENKKDDSKSAGDNPSGAWDNDAWGNGDENKNNDNKGGDAAASNDRNNSGPADNQGASDWKAENTDNPGQDWNNNADSKSQKSASHSRKSHKSGSGSNRNGNSWNGGSNNNGNSFHGGSNNNNGNGNGNGGNDSSSEVTAYNDVYPDDIFSMDDLARISRILKRDREQVWFRLSCAFRDKTGRHIPPEVFEERLLRKGTGRRSVKDV